MNIQAVVIAATMGSSLVPTLSAQTADTQATATSKSRWELIVPSGTMIPTGAQRSMIKQGNVSAVQLMYVARPRIAVTSSFSWGRSRDVATTGSPKLDVFTYDAGAEIRAASRKKNVMPFAGVGVGGRSYNHRKLDMDATHNLAAYGSVGGELAVRRVRVRLEARDYVSGAKPLTGAGEVRTGNDIVVLAGLRIVAGGR